MKTPLISTIILLSTMNVSAQLDPFKMPAEWAKDFTIKLSHTGSMSGGSSHVTFSYDSGKYEVTSRTEGPKEKVFVITEADRMAILKEMNSLNVDKIKIENTYAAVNDGWSNSLCFGVHCLEGGTSVKMSQEDKGIFLTAYRYLEDFAINKKGKMKKAKHHEP